MYSKRALPDREGMPPAKRLRENLTDLFLSNDVSGARAVSLFQDAAAAGAPCVKDLSKAAGGGRHLKN